MSGKCVRELEKIQIPTGFTQFIVGHSQAKALSIKSESQVTPAPKDGRLDTLICD